MPVSVELVPPVIAPDLWTLDRDLLAVCVFCAVGLALSLALVAYTDTFGEILEFAGPYLR